MKKLSDLSIDEIQKLPKPELKELVNKHALLDLVKLEKDVKLNQRLKAEKDNMAKFNLIIGILRRSEASNHFKNKNDGSTGQNS